MSDSLFQRVFLPGFLFQSVLIGGGYATGRELVEFFLVNGPVGGLLGLSVASLLFSAVAAVSFEFARLVHSYDYRRFFQSLLGRAWVLYEVAYLALVLLVLAVIAAASGELVQEHLGLPSGFGALALMVLIGILVFFGTSLVEKALAGWSFLLYTSYGLIGVIYLLRFGDDVVGSWSNSPPNTSVLVSAVKYVGYNVTSLPAILFCVRHMRSRQDAFTAGALAGPLAMIPALLFFLPLSSGYPEILSAPVPADFIMQKIGITWLALAFYVVIFGTFVETGAAFIHAINERVSGMLVERSMQLPRWIRSLTAIIALFISGYLAVDFGLVKLIARGYGTLTWVFVLVFLVPLFTLGLWKIIRRNSRQ